MELQLDVAANSDLSFMKKVSSESNYDFLKFYIDNIEQDAWSGEDDWSYHTYSVNSERIILNGNTKKILVLILVLMQHGLMKLFSLFFLILILEFHQ